MNTDNSLEKFIESQIKQKPELKEELEKAKRAVDIAMQVHNLRKERGLTQKQLAKLIGISQPNVARIESGDYTSYSFRTLGKVAKALNTNLNVIFTPALSQAIPLTYGVRNIRPEVFSLDDSYCYIYFTGVSNMDDFRMFKPSISKYEKISIYNLIYRSAMKDYFYSAL